MANSATWLTRDETAAMRGLAIIAIVLHNFCHRLRHIAQQNEYYFNPKNNDALLHALANPDSLLPVHLASYFGHYGVPVFLFVSGFGLVMKYESKGGPLPVWRFIRYHYLKLFGMMVAGFTGFVLVDNMMGQQYLFEWDKVVAQMLFCINLHHRSAEIITPGPYWFFGLMMQLYIIYRLLLWRRGHIVSAALVVCCYVVMATAGDMMDLRWLRYNFVGGMLAFCSGVTLARLAPRQLGRRAWAGLCIVFTALLVASCFWLQAWLWSPLFAAAATMALVKAMPPAILCHTTWLGGLSAAMFVSHPIVRRVLFHIADKQDIYTGILLYMICTVAVAWLFAKLMKMIPKPAL